MNANSSKKVSVLGVTCRTLGLWFAIAYLQTSDCAPPSITIGSLYVFLAEYFRTSRKIAINLFTDDRCSAYYALPSSFATAARFATQPFVASYRTTPPLRQTANQRRLVRTAKSGCHTEAVRNWISGKKVDIGLPDIGARETLTGMLTTQDVGLRNN